MLNRRIFPKKNSYKILKSVSCHPWWKDTKYFSCSSKHLKNEYLSFWERLEWESLNDIDYTNTNVYRKQLHRARNPVDLPGKTTESSFQFYTGSGIQMPLAHLTLSHSSDFKRSYFFNVPETMLNNYLNTLRKVPRCNCLFLTKLTWENVAGLCSVIVNSVMPVIAAGSTLPDGQILIYGPVGTATYIRKVLTSQFSEQQCNLLWPNFIFTEVGDGTLIDDPFLTLKVRELKPTNYCLTGTSPQPTVIYEFDKQFEHFRRNNVDVGDDIQTMASTGKEEYPESYHYQVAIVDCPTVDHAKSLFDNNYLTFPNENSNTRRVIVHQSNHQVLQTRMYQEWIGRNDHCTHISANNENAITHMPPITAFYRGACNKVSSLFFPLHGQYNFFDHLQAKTEKGEKFNSAQSYLVNFTRNQDSFSLYKFNTIVNTISPQVKTLDSNFEGILPKTEAVYPKLVILGSGSSSLSTRSQSAYLLQLKEDTSLLIDCGLGTLEQLYNHFSPQQFDEVLSSIKVIFISHKHIDHMSGLGSLLQRIIDVRKERSPTKKVIIVAVNPVTAFVTGLYEESVLYNNFQFLNIFPRKYWEIMHHFAPVESLLGVQWFFPVRVDHGPVTHGLILKVGDWKMVYSADTLPMNAKLIDYGQDTDLLIHESTFARHTENIRAEMKMHSYKDGALATAKAMNAQNVILTHFGPPFPLVPLIDISPPEGFTGNIFCAMDHLEFSFSQMHLLPNIHENLMHVFKHNCDCYVKKTGKKLSNEINKKNENTSNGS